MCVVHVCRVCVYVHAPVVVNNFTRSNSDAWRYIWMFAGNYNSAELLLMPNIAVVIFF